MKRISLHSIICTWSLGLSSRKLQRPINIDAIQRAKEAKNSAEPSGKNRQYACGQSQFVGQGQDEKPTKVVQDRNAQVRVHDARSMQWR